VASQYTVFSGCLSKEKRCSIAKNATSQGQIVDHRSSYLDRLFYVIAACTLLLLTFVGFEQFYLHGRAVDGGQITRQIVPLVVVHGLAMSSWVILFFVQSVLIVAGRLGF